MGLETPLKAPLATAHPSYPFSTKLFFFFPICSIVLLCFISWRAAALRSVSPSFKLRHHSWLLLGAFHICTPMTPIPLIIQNNNIAHWLNNAQCALHIADHRCCLKTLQTHSAHKLNSAHMTLNIVQDFAGKLLTAVQCKIPTTQALLFSVNEHKSTYFRACQSLLVHLGFLFRKLLHISFQVPTAGQSRWAGSGLNRKGADSFPWKLSLKLKTFWINNV